MTISALAAIGSGSVWFRVVWRVPERQ